MRRAGWVVAVVLAGGREAPAQNPAPWRPAPARPTVGDTVWLERRFPLPAGWRVRPGRLESREAVTVLSDAVVVRDGAGWSVRYPVAAWTPGAHTLAMPPVWRLGPDAQADSLLGGEVAFVVVSVLPDSAAAPAPRPALDPLRAGRRDALPVVLAVVGSLATLVGLGWWRRRPPRGGPPASPAGAKPETADSRWLEAGEAGAVAARAAGRLRAALASAVPEAHLGLSTVDCLAAAQRARPGVHQELADVLTGLDQVAFASRPQVDVARLADRARALAGVLER